MKYLICLFSKWRTKMWKRGKITWKYSLPCNTIVLRTSLRKLEFKKQLCWPTTYPEGKKENPRKHFSSFSLSLPLAIHQHVNEICHKLKRKKKTKTPNPNKKKPSTKHQKEMGGERWLCKLLMLWIKRSKLAISVVFSFAAQQDSLSWWKVLIRNLLISKMPN